MVKETPFDGFGFGEELSEAIINAWALEVGHHGFVGDGLCNSALELPTIRGIGDAQEIVELLRQAMVSDVTTSQRMVNLHHLL